MDAGSFIQEQDRKQAQFSTWKREVKLSLASGASSGLDELTGYGFELTFKPSCAAQALHLDKITKAMNIVG